MFYLYTGTVQETTNRVTLADGAIVTLETKLEGVPELSPGDLVLLGLSPTTGADLVLVGKVVGV